MKPICFIGARKGSKGVPNKNLRIINGIPLIGHTIKKAKKSKIFSHVIVSTEDKRIANIAKKFGAEIPFMRPKKLATDSATMEAVLLHGIKQLRALDYEFKTVVLLDCTVPFLKIKDIKKSVEMIEKQNISIVCGVYEQHLNPYFNIAEITKQGVLKLVKKSKKEPKNRQEAPIVYQMNGLYTFKADDYLKAGEKIMKKMMPLKIPIETGLMIDTEFEFKIAKLLMEKS